MRFVLLLVLLASAVLAAKPKENSLCDVCLGIVDTIQKALEHGDDVKKAVHDFCNNTLPSFLVAACEKVVANSLDFIIDALKEHKPEKEICESLSLC